jgi:hypothetical protein
VETYAKSVAVVPQGTASEQPLFYVISIPVSARSPVAMLLRFVVPALLVLAVAGCTDGASSDTPRRSSSRAAQAIVPGGTITGTVRERIPVGPYVYVRLETNGGDDLWTAVNEAPLEVGDAITVHNVMLMEQFQSQTLKRTFARIYFGALRPGAGQQADGALLDHGPSAVPDMAGSDMAASAMTSPGTPTADDAKVGPVEKATGPNAFAIAELWAQKAQLANTAVSVRGVVVKYTPGVMGKNWIHLQDGSGNAARGTIDLTATTAQTAALGDTVVVTGTVRINQDLGAGYRYALLLDGATLTPAR